MMKKYLITANIILYCRAWKETVEFYRDRLELEVLFSTDWFVEFRLNEMSRLSLSIADEKRSSVRSCDGKGITLSLEVNDIEAGREYAEKIGLHPSPLKNHPWNARVFYIFDPEGHRIEIWQPVIPAKKKEKTS